MIILWRRDLDSSFRKNWKLDLLGKFRCEFLQVHFLSTWNLIFKISNLCRRQSVLSCMHMLKCQQVWPKKEWLPGITDIDGLETSQPPRLVDLKHGWQEESFYYILILCLQHLCSISWVVSGQPAGTRSYSSKGLWKISMPNNCLNSNQRAVCVFSKTSFLLNSWTWEFNSRVLSSAREITQEFNASITSAGMFLLAPFC